MERQELKAKNPVVLQIAKQEQLNKKKKERERQQNKTKQNTTKQSKAKQNMGAEVHEEVVC